MDLASTQNPVHWTTDPVGFHAGLPPSGTTQTAGFLTPDRREVALPSPSTRWFLRPFGWPFVLCTMQHASSIDSLVRVSRRAMTGTVKRFARLSCPVCTRSPVVGRRNQYGGHRSGSVQPPHSCQAKHHWSEPWRLAVSEDSARFSLSALLFQPSFAWMMSLDSQYLDLALCPDWGAPHSPLDLALKTIDSPREFALFGILSGASDPGTPCTTQRLPRLHPRPEAGAQWPARGWSKVAWKAPSENAPPQHQSPPFPLRLQGLLTLFTEFSCILRSLYLCAIGPRSVCFLGGDTPAASNCSPKPFYSGIRPANRQGRTVAH